MSKYTPAVFQPTLRPSWAGAFEYIPTEELAKILKAITHFPNLEVEDSVFWNQTIKPDLEQQYQSFNETCEKRGRGARTYWGEHKLSLTITQDKLCKDKDKDEDENKDNKGGMGGNNFIPPKDADEVYEYAQVNGMMCSKEQAQDFYDYYSGIGWRIGNEFRTPINDWHPFWRKWLRNPIATKQAMKSIPRMSYKEMKEMQNEIEVQKILNGER